MRADKGIDSGCVVVVVVVVVWEVKRGRNLGVGE